MVKKALATTIILGFAMNSQAIVATFFGEDNAGGSLPVPNSAAAEADFLSNLVGVGTEDFESFASGATPPLNLDFGVAGTASMQGNGMTVSGPMTGTFPISGTKQVQGFANSFDILFSDPVAALGFYATDVGDVSGRLTLTFANGGATVIDVPHTLNNNGNAMYFGYINTDNPFLSVSFKNSSNNDRFGFDNMTIGNVSQVQVPEAASTILLLGLSLASVGVCRRKLG